MPRLNNRAVINAAIASGKLKYELQGSRILWNDDAGSVIDIDVGDACWTERILPLAAKGLHHAMRDGRAGIKDASGAVTAALAIAESIMRHGLGARRQAGSSLLAQALVATGFCKDAAEAGAKLAGLSPAEKRKISDFRPIAKAMLEMREAKLDSLPDDEEAVIDILG